MEFEDIPYEDIKTEEPAPQQVLLEHVKRHAIQINQVRPKVTQYTKTNTVKTKNLITKGPTDRFAFFANEYYPSSSDQRNIKYEAIVNGRRFDMNSLNNNRGGTKVIKYLPEDRELHDFEEAIKEPIKEAYLEIQVSPSTNYDSPIVSNLKVLVGEEVEEE